MQNTVKKQTPNQQRTLIAASEVFLATGFEMTSTAEIARLAKVSKRELSLHLADKRAMLATVDDLQHDILRRLTETP